MNLDNFEHYLDAAILERGKDYFEKGQVTSLVEEETGDWFAIVEGTDVYEVEIQLSEKGEMEESFCDCPYDWGPYCKHQVAVFYKLRSVKKSGDLKAGSKKFLRKSFNAVLSDLSKEELINIIIETAREYPDVKRHIQFKYAETENEVESCRKLVLEYINRAKHRGFVDWKHVQ